MQASLKTATINIQINDEQDLIHVYWWDSEFETVKTLSGRKAVCCDKHQFHTKMTVST